MLVCPIWSDYRLWLCWICGVVGTWLDTAVKTSSLTCPTAPYSVWPRTNSFREYHNMHTQTHTHIHTHTVSTQLCLASSRVLHPTQCRLIWPEWEDEAEENRWMEGYGRCPKRRVKTGWRERLFSALSSSKVEDFIPTTHETDADTSSAWLFLLLWAFSLIQSDSFRRCCWYAWSWTS